MLCHVNLTNYSTPYKDSKFWSLLAPYSMDGSSSQQFGIGLQASATTRLILVNVGWWVTNIEVGLTSLVLILKPLIQRSNGFRIHINSEYLNGSNSQLLHHVH